MNNRFKKWVSNPAINFLGSRRIKNRFSDYPIIIGGCARSGTSLLLSILAAHPNFAVIPTETGVFSNWVKNEYPEEDKPSYVPERPDRIHRYFISHIISQSVTRWCEKTPSNVRHIDKIIDYFNQKVRFIHIIRDGRDVLTSRHPEKPGGYWVSPERWISDVRGGLKFKNCHQVLTIKYEDLVLASEKTITDICVFLEEDFVDELRNWIDHSKVRKNRAWFQPLQKLHDASIGKWKNDEHRERLKEIMNYQEVMELLKELNYL